MKSGRIKPRGRWCVKRAAGLTSSRSSAPPAACLPSLVGGSAVHPRHAIAASAWPEHHPRARPPHPARRRLAGGAGMPRLALLAMAHRAWVATVRWSGMPPAGSAAVAHTARAANCAEVTRMPPVGSAAVPCTARTDNRRARRAAGTDSTDFRSRGSRNSRSTGHRSRYTDRMHSRPVKPRSATAPAAQQCVACHALPQPAGTAEMITWAKA